ncbi:mechanosensitive ion channel family protein [Marmoricola sp. RAF53]|uniref:mechanosensitive ion channel family protein n=1 Tax=Marmoricola sp. RAF53 TaxID=3233059 RepID=UPI003F99975D
MTPLALAAVAVVVAAATGLLLVIGLRRLARRLGVTVLQGRLWQSPVVALTVLVVLRVIVLRADQDWSRPVDHLLWAAQVGAVAWLLIVLVLTVEKGALAKHPDTGLAAAGSRHVRTKVTLLRRVSVAAIVTVAIGVLLWSIPEVRSLGVTVLASAGVVGIIAGLAAQTSLANIFAGVQIAFTDGIRVGDIVAIEDTWGRIDEITLTYVAVEVWDGTSLILPCTFFNTTPFRNWTHSGAAVQGTVAIAADWAVDVPRVRLELERLLRASPRWDGQHGTLVVDDAAGPTLTLTAIVSAADGDTLAALRWDVREGLVRHLQVEQPAALPRARLENVEPRET